MFCITKLSFIKLFPNNDVLFYVNKGILSDFYIWFACGFWVWNKEFVNSCGFGLELNNDGDVDILGC